MDEQLVIRHQDGDIVRKVKPGKILFTQQGGTWRVGLEVTAYQEYVYEGGEFDELKWFESENGDCRIHLIDYPVGEDDPRSKAELEIRVPRGEDPDSGRIYTNLYFGEHFQPNDNVIKVRKLADGEYLVDWTCSSKDVDYYDHRAKDSGVTVRCRASVVDRILYPW
jgi:hypothetical protein